MTTWVIGVDPSTRCLAFIAQPIEYDGDDTTALYPLLIPLAGPKETYNPRIAFRASNSVDEVADTLPLEPDDEVIFAIERGLVGRGGVSTSEALAFVSGALQSAAQHRSWTPLLINVSSWKKELTGRGNATKDDVAEHLRSTRRAVFARLMEEPGGTGGRPRQDLLDAVGVRSSAVGRLRAGRGLAQAS